MWEALSVAVVPGGRDTSWMARQVHGNHSSPSRQGQPMGFAQGLPKPLCSLASAVRTAQQLGWPGLKSGHTSSWDTCPGPFVVLAVCSSRSMISEHPRVSPSLTWVLSLISCVAGLGWKLLRFLKGLQKDHGGRHPTPRALAEPVSMQSLF